MIPNFSLIKTYSAIISSLIRLTLGLLLSIFLAVSLQAQHPFEEGKKWFQQRAAKADSFHAQPKYITRAIDSFEEALQVNIQPKEAAAFLLRSYYFKGMYTGLSEDEQMHIFDKGKALGERMLKRFPESVPIKFWYAANCGRWSDVNGFWAAATNGIAKKLRGVSKDIIDLNPEYQGGGGYRVLAQVHFYSPNIPLVMGWPSNDKARELIEKAMDIAPEHPTNLLLYAEILIEFDQDEKALTHLHNILQLSPRPSYLVEDRYVQYRARQLLQQQKSK